MHVDPEHIVLATSLRANPNLARWRAGICVSIQHTLYEIRGVLSSFNLTELSMQAQPQPIRRFTRRTALGENEYDTNFQKLDRDIMAAVSSAEADAVTPLMSKIYLRLLQAPGGCWESERVLHFGGETQEGKWVKAWDQLCRHLRVSSETAHKALSWMHDEGIIGYSAFKNGVGIRIFLNRAVSSIAVRPPGRGEKILRFPPASPGGRPASLGEAAFKDSFAVSEGLDSDINSRAPKNGAETNRKVKTPSEPAPNRQSHSGLEAREVEPARFTIPVNEIVQRLRNELEPCVRAAATQAAAREHERTRQWLEKSGIPKATRVAQHEAYNVLRSHGLINTSAGSVRAGLEVGRAGDGCATAAKPLTPEEISETAETCVALLEAQGKSIDVTLSEISLEGGGWLLPQDAPQVREAAQALLRVRAERR